MFDELYVVHCKRLAGRREYLSPILRDLGWDATWIDSCDPGEIPRRHLLRFRLRGPTLTVAEISVYLKHLEVFRSMARRQEALGFVIEDDAVFPSGFASTFARYRSSLTVPFDLVFFGACSEVQDTAGEGGSLFAEHLGTRSMSGYLITAAAARRLLAELSERPIIEPIDHTVNRIIAAGALKVLWSVPPLLLNGSETGRFGHSLGVHWREGTGRPGLYKRARVVTDRLVAAMPVRWKSD